MKFGQLTTGGNGRLGRDVQSRGDDLHGSRHRQNRVIDADPQGGKKTSLSAIAAGDRVEIEGTRVDATMVQVKKINVGS